MYYAYVVMLCFAHDCRIELVAIDLFLLLHWKYPKQWPYGTIFD